MDYLSGLAKQLKHKVEKLSERYQLNQKKLDEAERNNDWLKKQLALKDAEIEKLSRRIYDLKTAHSFSSAEGDNEEAKARINALVREIDKCIALLND